MSFALDVNVLLYASDTGSPLHQKAADFLESCLSGSEVFCIAWTTAMSYLRISTHPSILRQPLTVDDAKSNLQVLMEHSHARFLSEGEDFWMHYEDVTRDLVVRGNLVPDAHLAALLRQHGVRTLYTNDRDFRKFAFLDIRDPFSTRTR